MTSLSRRRFLTLLGATGVSASVTPSLLAAAVPSAATPSVQVQEPFTFLFVTDAHLQPELNGVVGTDMAFKKARAVKADFAINGGDHVFDSLAVPKQRALTLFDLYDKTEQDLGVKVYHTIGNHDVLGIYPASGIAQDDPLYGKKLFEQRLGKLYYSFDHKGHHFIVLDSIGITPDRAYEGRIDAAQLQWLAADLAALPSGTPVIVSVHIPLVTAFGAYTPEQTVAPTHHSLSVANANQVSISLPDTTFLAFCKAILTSTRPFCGRASRTLPAELSAVTGGMGHVSAPPKDLRWSRSQTTSSPRTTSLRASSRSHHKIPRRFTCSCWT